ncbi:MAG TPA: C40 family peptidase [Burkholderiales bacterium]|nr:C40 family peptidase [Burkholderiales bacterium]
MRPNLMFPALLLAGVLVVQSAWPQATDTTSAPSQEQEPAATPPELTGGQKMIADALNLVGIRYRRGGSDAETGFDCSGFVGYVFRETLGLVLPRTSRDISQAGTPVDKSELQPGDLVFFNTMRRAFSHVGIYLGNHLFVHAPRPGQTVRVEDIRDRYWDRRYNGARRVDR